MSNENSRIEARLCLAMGFILGCVGLVCNEWVLAKLFSADGVLGTATRIQIRVFDVALILLGLTLMKFREPIPRMLAALQKRKFLFYPVYFAFWVFLFLAITELGLRLKGYGPWNPQAAQQTMTVEPGGSLVRKHPTLGYTSLPGRFKIAFSDGYTFRVTHLNNTLRATHPVSADKPERPQKEIWILGCSFTYGGFLNDSETFPWQLQEKLPDCEVVNFGVSGYGTLHSLIQFREALEKGHESQVAIIAYAPFHDERNTLLRNWRKSIAPYNEVDNLVYPYARTDRDGNLQIFYDNVAYREFPFMRYSAFMHFLEKSYNKMEDRHVHSHEVSKAIIKEFSHLCRKNGVELVVATLFTNDMLDYCKKEGIKAIDLSVDWNVKENKVRDGHPSAIANRQYAQKLASFLKRAVLDKSQPVVARGKS